MSASGRGDVLRILPLQELHLRQCSVAPCWVRALAPDVGGPSYNRFSSWLMTARTVGPTNTMLIIHDCMYAMHHQMRVSDSMAILFDTPSMSGRLEVVCMASYCPT